jgi:hypothetical protein
MRTTVALLPLLSSLAAATPAPIYPGFQLVWSDGFEGSAGATPNEANWNLITEYAFSPLLNLPPEPIPHRHIIS